MLQQKGRCDKRRNERASWVLARIFWQRRVRLQSNASEIYSTCDACDVTSPPVESAQRGPTSRQLPNIATSNQLATVTLHWVAFIEMQRPKNAGDGSITQVSQSLRIFRRQQELTFFCTIGRARRITCWMFPQETVLSVRRPGGLG